MKDGQITQAGKYDDILSSGSDFFELVGAQEKALSALDSIETSSVSENTTTGEEVSGSAKKVVQDEETNDVSIGPKRQIVQDEEREKGSVGLLVYWKYLTTAYGGALVPFVLLAQILYQLLQIGSSYWMAWATPVSKDVEPPVGGSTLIIVYVALAIGSSFCVLAQVLLIVMAGYKTATLLFNKMHLSIFRAPMSFFDATPSGRILNRVRK